MLTCTCTIDATNKTETMITCCTCAIDATNKTETMITCCTCAIDATNKTETMLFLFYLLNNKKKDHFLMVSR